ncbi:WAP four-disulfide core domain protein 2-like [Macrobrachium nipponense]|uniref:WAP four-disulfide core domain protein 2-like n=1 Tax=Macrobrachium nipponense TaxID=159736 RepID=UPI0030C7D9A9
MGSKRQGFVFRSVAVFGISCLLFITSLVSCRPQTQDLFYKPGKCPNTTGIIGLCMRSEYNCNSDDECLGHQKCCPYGCLRECSMPGDKIVYCPDWCSNKEDYMCGDDGKTYLNPCHLQYAVCTENPALTKAYSGACRG